MWLLQLITGPTVMDNYIRYLNARCAVFARTTLSRVEKLFEAVLDGKIDKRTAKVIKIDDLYDSIVIRVIRYTIDTRSGDDTSARIQLPKKPLPRFN
jgi:hypothetical protein